MRASLLHGIAHRVLTFQSVWGAGLDTSSTATFEGWGPGTAAGIKVTQDSALRLDAVYGCVRLLADSVAQLPLDTFVRTSDGRRDPYPLPSWLESPNAELTRYELFERMMASLLLDGNAYVYVSRQTNGTVAELIPLHPSQVHPERDRATRKIVFHVSSDEGGRVGIPAAEMLHVRGFTVGGLTGLSPIAYARQTIGRGVAAEKFQSQWLGDGAIPSSILSTDQTMTREQAQRNQEEWVASHSGRRRPAFLSGGLKWEAITLSPDDAQALETEQWTVQKIARLYRVPPHMIGDLTRSTYSNIEHQSIDYVTHTLNPWLVRIEQAMAAMPNLLPSGVYPRFNVAGLLRGDTPSRYQAYAVGRQWGWLSADDILALEDHPPLPDGAGQVYLQPMNMVAAGADVGTLLTTQVNAAGALVRAGFDPAAALGAVGLDPIAHLGLLPITVQAPDIGGVDLVAERSLEREMTAERRHHELAAMLAAMVRQAPPAPPVVNVDARTYPTVEAPPAPNVTINPELRLEPVLVAPTVRRTIERDSEGVVTGFTDAPEEP